MNWLNQLAESRGLSIKVYLNEVYAGMFHGAEPCTMEIDVFYIMPNYSNIVSFRCNFQTNRGIIRIEPVGEPYREVCQSP